VDYPFNREDFFSRISFFKRDFFLLKDDKDQLKMKKNTEYGLIFLIKLIDKTKDAIYPGDT